MVLSVPQPVACNAWLRQIDDYTKGGTGIHAARQVLCIAVYHYPSFERLNFELMLLVDECWAFYGMKGWLIQLNCEL